MTMLQSINGRQVFLLWFNDGRAAENEFIGVYESEYAAISRGEAAIKDLENSGPYRPHYFYEEHFVEWFLPLA